MTLEELKTLIDSDATATALAEAGNDSGCAARCAEIAPKVRRKLQLSTIGFVDVYANAQGIPGALLADSVLTVIETVSLNSPLIARIYKFTEPGTHPDSLVDWGSVFIQQMLMAPTNQGGCGLTQQQLAPILNASLIPTVVTADDVSEAMRPSRPNGKVGS